ncbi:hypothetical protein THAOC_36671, partial [Thalassiosira oceanica]
MITWRSIWRQELGLMSPLLSASNKDVYGSTGATVEMITISANNNGILVDCDTPSKMITWRSIWRQEHGLMSPPLSAPNKDV